MVVVGVEKRARRGRKPAKRTSRESMVIETSREREIPRGY